LGGRSKRKDRLSWLALILVAGVIVFFMGIMIVIPFDAPGPATQCEGMVTGLFQYQGEDVPPLPEFVVKLDEGGTVMFPVRTYIPYYKGRKIVVYKSKTRILGRTICQFGYYLPEENPFSPIRP